MGGTTGSRVREGHEEGDKRRVKEVTEQRSNEEGAMDRRTKGRG